MKNWILCTFVVALIVSSSMAMAWRDDFNGSAVDSSAWQVDSNSGIVTVSNGSLHLSSPGNPSHFPYLYTTSNPFPTTGNFKMTVGLQYTYLGPDGIGMSATTLVPTNGESFYSGVPDNNRTWDYWGDSYLNAWVGNAYHNLEWDY